MHHPVMRRKFRGIGELPETLARERAHGKFLDPSAGLAVDWTNRFLLNQFGTLVGTSSQTVLMENSLRCYLLIQNRHAANNLFVSFGGEASSFGGFIIRAGGSLEMIGGENGGAFVPRASVNVAGSAADTHVIVGEGTLEPYQVGSR